MVRVKRGNVARKRRKKILQLAKVIEVPTLAFLESLTNK